MTAIPAPTRALQAAIALGLIADAGLVILLLAISGFVFGGPEGANGELSAVIGWSLTLAVCVISPLIGLVMWRRQRWDLALAITWLPGVALLVGWLISLF